MVEDGEGGYITTWVPSETSFLCAIVMDTDAETETAEKKGSTANYTITTSRDVSLKHGDVLRRTKDNKTFVVLTNQESSAETGRQTPVSASLDMRQVKAKEWKNE